MNEQNKLKKINESLEELLGLPPMLDLFSVKNENMQHMRDGMVNAYSHEGFRMYLESEIRSALSKSINTRDTIDAQYFKARVAVLKQLLSAGHLLYSTTIRGNVGKSPLETLHTQEVEL